jgi:hypothetical protein
MKKSILALLLLLVPLISAHGQGSEPVDKPRLLIQVHDRDNEWYKLAVELLSLELKKSPSSIAIIRVRDDKGLRQRLQWLRKGAAFVKIDKPRLIYQIIDSQDYDTEGYIADLCSDVPTCNACSVIRATDFDQLDKLFRIRRVSRGH